MTSSSTPATCSFFSRSSRKHLNVFIQRCFVCAKSRTRTSVSWRKTSVTLNVAADSSIPGVDYNSLIGFLMVRSKSLKSSLNISNDHTLSMSLPTLITTFDGDVRGYLAKFPKTKNRLGWPCFPLRKSTYFSFNSPDHCFVHSSR